MPTILLTNHYEDAPFTILKNIIPANFELIQLNKNLSDLEVQAPKADYFLISGRVKINKQILLLSNKLKMIQRTGVGLDSMDLNVIKKLRIPLYVNKGVNSISVAEHTLMLILASLKRLSIVDSNTKKGIWIKQAQGVQNHELSKKTVGLIGMGNIGKTLVSLLKGFNCNILYFDKFRLTEEEEMNLDIKYCSLKELYMESDIVSLHCPLTAENKNMISVEEFKLMKKSAVIINTSRGELIDDEALINALIHGRISFAGLDVYSKEPLSINDELIGLNNIILTPHIAGITYESFSLMMEEAIRNITLFDCGQLELIEDKRVV